MDKIKVAAIQFNCRLGDKEWNVSEAERRIAEAAEAGAVLIALPELFPGGYRTEEADYEIAEPIPGPTTARICALCRKYGVYVAGNMIERSGTDGVLYDTSFIAGESVIGTYRKVFLWQAEQLRFKNGTDLPVFDLGFARVGLEICYEAGFPEVSRILTLKGAQIIINSAAFGGKRAYVWDLATRARALENGVFFVGCGRSGQEKDDPPFAGSSRIIDPQGNIIAEAGGAASDETIFADIDLGSVARQRLALPYMRDYNLPLIAGHFGALLRSGICDGQP